MNEKKLISILIPTRKRFDSLNRAIQSIINKSTHLDLIEILLRMDSDDAETINMVKNADFNNKIDIKIIIGDRGNGYKDIYKYLNELFNVSVGKWIIPFGDDMWIESNDWVEQLIKIDELNKLGIIKLNDQTFILIPREIPEVFGFICNNPWTDIWYNDIAKALNLYIDSEIIFGHIREMNGETAEQRELYFRELEKSDKWKGNRWENGPPNYDIQSRNDYIEILKNYIDNRNFIKSEFSKKLFNFFNSIKNKELKTINDINIPDSITCTFVNGPFVEIIGNSNSEYDIKFIDSDENRIVHEHKMFPYHWTRANRQWFTNWKIQIYSRNKLIYEHKFNCENKKVYVHLSSESIGDTIAWFPYVEEFRKKHNCKMVCSTFHNYFFEKEYPDIEFVKPGTTVHNLYAMYEIGIYDNNFDRNKNDHKKIPLQKVASDMLGLEFRELRPNIHINGKSNINGKYVVISTESTAQCKFWNYDGGWQEIVDYLASLQYKVVVVQKNKSELKNIIDATGGKLQDAINIINGAEFTIGISSGISWLSWALKKKVILISGFTKPWYEFYENCYRIFNSDVCNGCWHDYIFDKGDWYWCPLKKDFECSSKITPKTVISTINKVLIE